MVALRSHTCNMGRWSEMSLKIIPFTLESILSILLVKILSIRVAVCSVILVGLVIIGQKEEVKSCSLNLLAISQVSD